MLKEPAEASLFIFLDSPEVFAAGERAFPTRRRHLRFWRGRIPITVGPFKNSFWSWSSAGALRSSWQLIDAVAGKAQKDLNLVVGNEKNTAEFYGSCTSMLCRRPHFHSLTTSPALWPAKSMVFDGVTYVGKTYAIDGASENVLVDAERLDVDRRCIAFRLDLWRLQLPALRLMLERWWVRFSDVTSRHCCLNRKTALNARSCRSAYFLPSHCVCLMWLIELPGALTDTPSRGYLLYMSSFAGFWHQLFGVLAKLRTWRLCKARFLKACFCFDLIGHNLHQ